MSRCILDIRDREDPLTLDWLLKELRERNHHIDELRLTTYQKNELYGLLATQPRREVLLPTDSGHRWVGIEVVDS